MRIVGSDSSQGKQRSGSLSPPKRVSAAVDASGSKFDAFVLAALQRWQQ
jgi:hypothetical protein